MRCSNFPTLAPELSTLKSFRLRGRPKVVNPSLCRLPGGVLLAFGLCRIGVVVNIVGKSTNQKGGKPLSQACSGCTLDGWENIWVPFASNQTLWKCVIFSIKSERFSRSQILRSRLPFHPNCSPIIPSRKKNRRNVSSRLPFERG